MARLYIQFRINPIRRIRLFALLLRSNLVATEGEPLTISIDSGMLSRRIGRFPNTMAPADCGPISKLCEE